MEDSIHRAVAIVGVGAILPDAPNAPAFWDNVKSGRYSVTDVPADRWDPGLYYDPDPSAPDKTYSKIGGWVREYSWDPMKWRLPIPPRVADAMDIAQKWAVACTREALEDYGYPKRPLDVDRTAVILGNAMAGEKHYLTALRVFFPEYAKDLANVSAFAALPESTREAITRELHERRDQHVAPITEDTMPGELANCMAGRIANLYNFHGPNYVCDAACASAMAAISSAVEGLLGRDFDVAVTGGVDRNMGAPTFVKFCKIGALSATGTRPYAQGADGFVMGEGSVIFLLKRLEDAERDEDKIYAVLRGIGGSSDGRGKGITAPNPVGQRFCIERAWKNAGLPLSSATMIEGHGTSTRVGDVVEAQSIAEVLGSTSLPIHSVALGSVKSNIGHLKSAAGSAGILKAAYAIHDKVLPPSLNCDHPSRDIDFAHSPLFVNTELRPWDVADGAVRRAGVSAFGFGGTNFHVVMEEHVPGRTNGNGRKTIAVPVNIAEVKQMSPESSIGPQNIRSEAGYRKAPLRGALVLGASTESELVARLRHVHEQAVNGIAPALAAPKDEDLKAAERIAIDYTDAADLATKAAVALKAFASNQPAFWKAIRAQGIFHGSGPAPKVAFLYTGQGSQYVNMLKALRSAEPIVAETFAEADRVMTPILGRPLTDYIFIDKTDPEALERAEDGLRQTAITQPAILAADLALTRLLAAYGIIPDMTMGHSLGEYGALCASGALPFADALEAVSARGREMTRVSMADNGKMAAVFAPLAKIEELLKSVKGYVVIANVNSENQAVIGGATTAVEEAIALFTNAGFNVVPLPVSHAFHTSIVAPASGPLKEVLKRLKLQSPKIPIIANVDGTFYPTGHEVVPQMIEILGKQIASPVQFVRGLQTLYDAGARVFVEVGPKKALQGFADELLGGKPGVLALFTNHPKTGDVAALNQALCGLYAAGLGGGAEMTTEAETTVTQTATRETVAQSIAATAPGDGDKYVELGRMFSEVLERAWRLYGMDRRAPNREPVAITGAALGLPGTEHVFSDENVLRILRGDQFIGAIPERFKKAIAEKHVTRLVKSATGTPSFEEIEDVADVIKLAGRGGALDLEKEYGMSAERVSALERSTRLAIAAGLEALRDAGIPLVMRYKTTSIGTKLPDRWGLPDAMRDDTAVIFASAFPGYDAFAEYLSGYYTDHARREQLTLLETIRSEATNGNTDSAVVKAIDKNLAALSEVLEREPYLLDRKFLFRTLSMGHSQFAEYIGARGPNTQINAACASTSQAMSIAEDWIRAGRCRRVVIISADDATSDHLMEWIGAGFLASGAAATDENVEDAAIPFDRRRHGLIVGMGAAALVIESADAARERGITPICEVLGAVTANSAFHGSRLDIQHIGQMMEEVVRQAEVNGRISRTEIAPKTLFVSHETYTPARGGSASAEIFALRKVFGDAADQIVIANTKGMTGHAMGTGIEEVVAVKALETGWVPPVANFKEVDPELGALNLSKGGTYPIEFALRLGAGFGSQISMALLRWVKTKDGVRKHPAELGYAYRIADPIVWQTWLSRITGEERAELEVVNRTLRVRDQRVMAKTEAASSGNEASAVATQAQRVAEPEVVSASPATVAFSTLATKTVEVAQATKSDVLINESAGAIPVTLPQESRPAPDALPSGPTITAASPITPDDIKERILDLVVEKTGYPKDMLDVDLDLEADLGVDTVKQAEMFAAIRQIYNIPRDENRKLRDYPTLAHVIRFVLEMRPDLANAVAAPEPALASETPKQQTQTTAPIAPATLNSAPQVNADGSNEAAVRERVLDLVVEKTGYPKDMLDLDLDLEADLGVDTVKQAEMFAAIREIYKIPRDENRKLRDYPTLAHVIRFVLENTKDNSTQSTPIIPIAVAVDHVKQVGTTKPEAATQASASTLRFGISYEDIKTKILEIVSEKTGYPMDMLDLDLDLEADLGVDTVKQAEMFAAVRAAYGIPRDESLKLREFPTLAHVIRFAQERTVKTSDTPEPSTAPVPALSQSTQHTVATIDLATFDEANKIPRRVPVPTLRPPLTLCKATGVTLDAGDRVVVMPDRNGVCEALCERLKEKGVQVCRVEPSANPEDIGKTCEALMFEASIKGVFWLSALDDAGSIASIDIDGWREAMTVRVKSLYTTMRTLNKQIATAGTFLVAATRMGGQHGYDDSGALTPTGGAVTGFTKAFKREQPNVVVKAIDFEAGRKASDIAEILIQECLKDPGAVEVGYKDGLRWTLALEERSAEDGHTGLALSKDCVFLITGAAGSIVSAITADLAAASGGTFYLLDLVAEPDANNPDLKKFSDDKEGLKRDLFARMQAQGQRPTPALIEKELASVERAQAALAAIEAVRKAGGTAHYFSVNLGDAAAIARIVEEVRKRHGKIDVLVHAAGLERSHFLPDKEPKEFDLVFDVKADGWFNLMHAIGNTPLAAVVAFSSIAGRFGNAGQTDYSSANDLLCKCISNLRRTRPDTRGIVIDWTAWGGIGMATRGSIPKMMELAGIDMLPPDAGIPLIRRELTVGGTKGEVVIGKRLGVLLKEWDETGGIDPTAFQSAASRMHGPMLGAVVRAAVHEGVQIEVALDPKVQPFLNDHRIDGIPVLPGVMGIEAFAELARCMCPGWDVERIGDIDFLAPFKFYRDEPRTLILTADFHQHGEKLIATCSLIGKRLLSGQAQPQETVHFKGQVQLCRCVPQPLTRDVPANSVESVLGPELIYRIYFHGPAYQVLKRAWWDGERVIGEMARHLPENHFPAELPTIMTPRLLELCFQTAGLWELAARGELGLPLHVKEISVLAAAQIAEGPIYAVVTPRPDRGGCDAEVVDRRGNVCVRIRGYQTNALPNAVEAQLLKSVESVLLPRVAGAAA